MAIESAAPTPPREETAINELVQEQTIAHVHHSGRLQQIQIESTEGPDSSAHSTLSPTISRWLRIALIGSILTMPLYFGAVHPVVELFYYLVSFAALGLLALRAPAVLHRRFYEPEAYTFRIIVGGFAALLAYVLLQTLYFLLFPVAHPVLGTTPNIANFSRTVESTLSILFVLSSFIVGRLLLAESNRFQRQLVSAGTWCAAIVCAIGLSHWLYDNGKLFWIAAPENIFISNRARWPFVNANHLGHYLLLAALFVGASLSQQLQRLRQIRRDRGLEALSPLSSFLASKSYQHSIFVLYLLLLGQIALVLTVLCTLSRSSWVALAGWTILFALFSGPLHRTPEPQLARIERKSSRRRRRESSFNLPYTLQRIEKKVKESPRVLRLLPIIFGALLLVLLLNDTGQELVADRIDYGLAYSKDDMRFQFYKDSAALLQPSLFFGIGIGAWNDLYTRVMDPSLAGLNPEFLHSDPYQLLTEVGIFGFLPIVAVFVLLSIQMRRRIKQDPVERKLLVYFGCGLCVFFFASLFDFPFRIPAILFELSLLLSLTSFYLDGKSRPHSS